MRTTSLIVFVITILLAGCGTEKPMSSSGDPDSPIVVADSSTTTNTYTAAAGPTPSQFCGAPNYGRPSHESFALSLFPGGTSTATISDTYDWLWIIKRHRRVTTFEVCADPGAPANPFTASLEDYKTWSLAVTGCQDVTCAASTCKYQISSTDNKTISINPGNCPLMPVFDNKPNRWELLKPPYIKEVVLTADSHLVYPQTLSTHHPRPGYWSIGFHYCKRNDCK